MKCKCGCGLETNKGKTFIHGHNWRNKIRSKESVEKSRLSKLGKCRKDMIGNKFAKGNTPNKTSFKKGEHRSPKTEFKSGKEHIYWKDGKTSEQYGNEFTRQLKEQIRKRDNYRCQQCFRNQNELRRKLNIHHIDFNKKNNSQNNLISLCDNCHSQTNYNREDWTKYFQNVVIR